MKEDRAAGSVAAASEPPAVIIPAIGLDGKLFPVEKLEAHRKAQFHLAVSVFVFSGDKLLLQRRAFGKYHCGGLWANSCCTHPHWGESVAACAARRLQEELGITLAVREHRVVEYSATMPNGLHEHERVHMFSAEADKNKLQINPDPQEVGDIRWTTAADLRGDMTHNPQRYTPWLRIYLDRFPDLVF